MSFGLMSSKILQSCKQKKKKKETVIQTVSAVSITLKF